jgi:fermentation-respiration switch protein FrsA (DUF1100 family)
MSSKTSAAFLLLFFTACKTIELREDHFFLPGPPENPAPIAVAGATAEFHTIHVADGTAIGAVYIVDPAADIDILYFGGNASRIDDVAGPMATVMAGTKTNLFAADYRGYGRSKGTPTIEALKTDALATFDYLRTISSRRPIVVHGFSLGSFLAAYVAKNRAVAGLVIESSAPGVLEWVHASVPVYAKPFIRIKIAPALLRESNKAALEQYKGPLLIVTGTKDEATPPALSQRLFAGSASADKRIVIVPDAVHGNAFRFRSAQKEYAEFLGRIRD